MSHSPARDGSRRTVRTIDTPHGPARAILHTPIGATRHPTAGAPAGALVLSHGAGGAQWSRDLLALTTLADATVRVEDVADDVAADVVAAVQSGDGSAAGARRRPWQVVLVEQPWRVAGRRVAAPPTQLDAAWVAVLAALRRGRGALAGPLVVGGRSAGARVACRTSGAVGADGVLALAFPLHPPGQPAKSRAGELAAVDVPVLVVQGVADPFGSPEELRRAVPGRRVVAVRGGHSFSADPADVLAAASDWLTTTYDA